MQVPRADRSTSQEGSLAFGPQGPAAPMPASDESKIINKTLTNVLHIGYNTYFS